MNRIRRIRPIRRLTSVLAVLAGALIASAAAVPAAFATRVPPASGQDGPASAPPPVHTLFAGGMPGWQITLIAAGAAVLAAAAAVLLDRARAARRHQTAPSA
jgi:hypothetical protein